jgi:hypothetical protein
LAQTELERLTFQLSADVRRMQRDLDKANGVVDRNTRQMQAKFDKMGQEAGRAFAGMSLAAGAAFGAITAYAIKAASDAEETANAFSVAFGTLTDEANKFAESYSKNVGRSFTEVQGNMARAQLVLTGIGVEATQALDMVKAIQSRSVDIGSLFNVEDADAFRAIMSGIAGEAEPLKRFGVAVNDAAVKAELLRMGFKGSTQDATETQKTVARLNIIMRQSIKADGDAINTKDSLANSTKAAKAEFEAAAVALGKNLLPAATAATTAASELLVQFNAMPDSVKMAGLALLGLVAASGPIMAVIAGLSNLIKMAAAARASLVLLANPIVAAGASAALIGGIAASDDIKGVTANRLTRDPNSLQTQMNQLAASDRDLANARDWYRQGNRARSNPEDVKLLDKLISDRAASVAARETAKVQAELDKVMSAFQLPTTTPGGAAGGAGGTRAAKPKADAKYVPVAVIEEVTIDPKTLWDSMTPQAIDTNPTLGQPLDKPFAIGGELVDAAKYEQIEGGIYSAVRGGLEAGFDEGIPGAMRYLADALKQTLLDQLASGLTNMLMSAFSGAGGGGGFGSAIMSIFGFRANGGPVSAGAPYIVGEKGPELMVPRMSGTVISNSALRSARAASPVGKGNTVTIVQPFHLHAEGAVMTNELMAALDQKSKSYAAQATAAAVGITRKGFASVRQRQEMLGST